MSNILLTATRWTDNAGVSPPSYWTGSVYEFIGINGTLKAENITATAVAGDVVKFTMLVVTPASTGLGGYGALLVNGATVFTQPVDAAGSYAFTSATLNAGDVVEFKLDNTYSPGGIYGGDIRVTPTPPVVVASPESLSVAANSSSNAVVTSVTADGTVTAATLAVATNPTHGTVALVNNAFLYTPNPNISGLDSFTYTGTYAGVTSAPATVSITIVAPTKCADLGRVTRAYVSAYTRDRIHQSQLMAQEKRCLIANFNGALPVGRTIASVIWSVSNPMFVNLSQCDITGRETACIITAQWRGSSLVRCSATTDDGDVYTQYFAITIRGYWFQGDVPGVQGPYTISAQAVVAI